VSKSPCCPSALTTISARTTWCASSTPSLKSWTCAHWASKVQTLQPPAGQRTTRVSCSSSTSTDTSIASSPADAWSAKRNATSSSCGSLETSSELCKRDASAYWMLRWSFHAASAAFCRRAARSNKAGRVAASGVGLLSQFQRVLDFDAQVLHRAFEFAVPKQELHSAQVLRAPINQRGLRPAH